MLKEITKRLPFIQPSGKREKNTGKPERPSEPDVFHENGSSEPLWDNGDPFWDNPEEAVAEHKPAPPAETAPEDTAPQEAESSPGERDLKAGLEACRVKDYPAALDAFLRAAELGCMEAQFLCGQMYQRGIAADASDRLALNWYRRAAKQGFMHAQMACAALFEEGRGTGIDLKRALFWYEQAAKQGAVDAQLKCGVMYSSGRAETKNPKKARRWLEAAAGSGNKEAQRILNERF